METIRKIRCAYGREGKPIRAIAREFNLARNTVKKVLRGEATEFVYSRSKQPLPKLGAFEESLRSHLEADAKKPRREQRTGVALFEQLEREGYRGGYDSVRRFVAQWRSREKRRVSSAFVPLSFDPG